jgi:ElaB/YqjD/DUF883 family membrane-anchored ribosome-binding protein
VVWKIVVPIALVVVAVVVVLAVTGGDSKEDKALAQVCGARADISQQLKTLQGLTPGNGAADQAKQSLQAIADDLKTIADARGDLSDARRSEIQSANESFVAGVKDAAGSVTDLVSLQTAAGDVKATAQKLAQTYTATYGKIDCNET